MERETSREKVLNLLTEELSKDRAPTVIISMSELGLVEMTRKRIRPSLTSMLCEPCSYCEGKGYTKKKNTVASEIFRSLEREGMNFVGKGNLLVHCHSDVADWIYGEDGETLEYVEKRIKRNVVFKVEPHFHIEEFEIQTIRS